VMSEWHPISTAPINTPFIGLMARVRHYKNFGLSFREPEVAVCNSNGGNNKLWEELGFTHWKPLDVPADHWRHSEYDGHRDRPAFPVPECRIVG
jgi:hypothetical protein